MSLSLLTLSIRLYPNLGAELCRIPLKPHQGGKIQLMPKTEMKKPPLSLPSPDLADAMAYAFSSSRLHPRRLV